MAIVSPVTAGTVIAFPFSGLETKEVGEGRDKERRHVHAIDKKVYRSEPVSTSREVIDEDSR